MAEAVPSNPSQEQTWLANAKTDPSAVGVIYDAYADQLYGFLFKRCGHKETAEDLVSRTFLKFMEALPTFEWRGISLGAWLYRAASNALTDHWRSATVRLDRELDTDTWDPPAVDQNPAWYAELTIERAKTLEAMKELSARDQEVLDLRYFAGLEVDEIAKNLNISGNHASVLIYRATGRLRSAYLTKFGA